MPRITIAEFEMLIERDLPFAHEFGFRVESLERGAARVRLPYRDVMLRPGGTVAGPVLMTLADFTMYAVTMSVVGNLALAVTTNLNINFLRRPKPRDVIAEGRVIKAGRRLVVSEVAIYTDGEAEPVAHVTGTYSIPPGQVDERR
jgi:uncharacterized protein (TIGR00369 family)